MEIRSTNDEPRKNAAHEFDRSVCWDKTNQFRILPAIQKMKIIGDKYRFRCCEMKFNDKINLASVADVMVNNYSLDRQYFDEDQ